MKYIWNNAWLFAKDKALPRTEWESVNLPHTWNAKDGQDMLLYKKISTQ